MKTPTVLLAVLTLVAGAVALAEEPEVGTVNGEVVTLDSKTQTLTVEVESATEIDPPAGRVSFTVNAETKILKDGQTIDLAAIKPQDSVTVNYRESGGLKVALTIGVHGDRA